MTQIPEMQQKIEKKFRFSDTCIGIRSCEFSQYWTGYLPWAANVFTNSPYISPNTWGDIFQIKFTRKDEKTWENCSHGDFAIIRDTFTCLLSKGVPKRHFLQGGVTKFSTVCNFGSTLAMTMIFFFKMFKIWYRFQKWNKKLRKTVSFFRYLHLK